LTPAYGAAVAAPTRLTFVQMALWALPVMALLLYSGGWELPLVGENATEAGSAILRVGYLPAYAAGFALIALRPGSTLRVMIRQPFLIALLAVVVASVFRSIRTRRPGAASPWSARRWAESPWPPAFAGRNWPRWSARPSRC